MSKKANGQGSLCKRTSSSGKTYWEGRATVGYDPLTGKPCRRTVTAKTQAECRKKLSEITSAVDCNSYIPPSKITLSEWLDEWYATYAVRQSQSTKEQYRIHIDRHIKPYIGRILLSNVNEEHIQSLYNTLSAKQLNAKSVRLYTTPLRLALKQAYKLKRIPRNPCDIPDLPKKKERPIKPLSEAEIPLFLSAIKGTRFENAFALSLFAGLRKGEILGLSWENVLFDSKEIVVTQQLSRSYKDSTHYYIQLPKGGKTRTIQPPAVVFDYLKAERARQNSAKLKAGALWDNAWNLVFTDNIGHHYRFNTFDYDFSLIAKEIGRPDATPHTLRHSTATIAIASGADIKSVQGLLGHADASLTLNVYAGLSKKMQEDTALRMENYFNLLCSNS